MQVSVTAAHDAVLLAKYVMCEIHVGTACGLFPVQRIIMVVVRYGESEEL